MVKQHENIVYDKGELPTQTPYAYIKKEIIIASAGEDSHSACL